MGYRRLMFENPAELSVSREQLTVDTGEKTHRFPLEDIDALLIESRQVRLSAYALSKLAEYGCAVFLCDEKHMPCCTLLPYMQHSRQLGLLELQLSVSEPRKKRLWQQIVKGKIANQALCLEYFGDTDGAARLTALSGAVLSGDSKNAEATAAAFYFPRLFGGGFFRGDDRDPRNAALNYGYAILRGAIARTLAVYGFTCCLGLHHKGGLNAFNLADDLIEPYRPLADRHVGTMRFEADALEQEHKRALFDLLSYEMRFGDALYSVSYSIELFVQELLRCMREPERPLTVPAPAAPRHHAYE